MLFLKSRPLQAKRPTSQFYMVEVPSSKPDAINDDFKHFFQLSSSSQSYLFEISALFGEKINVKTLISLLQQIFSFTKIDVSDTDRYRYKAIHYYLHCDSPLTKKRIASCTAWFCGRQRFRVFLCVLLVNKHE